MKISAALLTAAIAAGPALAADPIDGTWKVDTQNAQFDKKPSVYLLKDGTYSCTSCVPVFTVKADGALHKMAGIPYIDEASVTVVDKATISEVDKLKGKLVSKSTSTLSADGKTLTTKWTDLSAPSGKPVEGKTTQVRVTAVPVGAHGISGKWQTTAVSGVSDAGLTVSFKTVGNDFKMSTPGGYGYAASFGGKPVLVTGDNARTMAAVRRIDKNTVEETDSRDGKTVSVTTLTAVPGGKQLKVKQVDMLQGKTLNYTMNRL